MFSKILVATTAVLWLVGPLDAQQASASAQPQCPRDAEPIPAELAGWSSRTPLTTAAEGEGPAIAVGKAYDLTLRSDQELRLPNLPGPVKDRVGNGGITHFTVDRAGTWRVAISAGAWIDVVQGGKALESIAHGHGPACSGIGKMVDFALTPGRYTLTFDGNESQRLTVLIVPVR